MSITRDMKAAIRTAEANGSKAADMRLRLGISAMLALAAVRPDIHEAMWFKDVPIEDAGDAFPGWELVE